jgi:hypothetical protein
MRFVDGAVVGVGSFKPGKQKKPGNFIRHDFFFPIQSSNEPLEGTSRIILLLKNDANDGDLETNYFLRQH